MKQLPPTGTAALLEVISPYIPDDLINSLFAEKTGRGRPSLFSAAQLFRVNLLALLTPAHSFNLVVSLLAEHRAWRDFARLRNRRVVPDAKMLHEFRQRLDLNKLRCVNRHLLTPVLEGCSFGLRLTPRFCCCCYVPATLRPTKNSVEQVARNQPKPGAGLFVLCFAWRPRSRAIVGEKLFDCLGCNICGAIPHDDGQHSRAAESPAFCSGNSDDGAPFGQSHSACQLDFRQIRRGVRIAVWVCAGSAGSIDNIVFHCRNLGGKARFRRSVVD